MVQSEAFHATLIAKGDTGDKTGKKTNVSGAGFDGIPGGEGGHQKLVSRNLAPAQSMLTTIHTLNAHCFMANRNTSFHLNDFDG